MTKIVVNKREMPYDVNEAMKLLRTNLQFCGKDKKVIMITSTLADEGKSTVSINLCRSLAQLGSRVILVDTDMRKSVLAERFTTGRILMGALGAPLGLFRDKVLAALIGYIAKSLKKAGGVFVRVTKNSKNLKKPLKVES